MNTPQSYSVDPQLFVSVYKMLVVRAKHEGISARFAVSFSSKLCKTQREAISSSVSCENGWYWNPETEALEQCENQEAALSGLEYELPLSPDNNPYSVLYNCTLDHTQYYPGDSFVDWIVLQAVNEDYFESAGDVVHKAMQIAQQVSRSKPIMWVAGATAHLNS